MRAPLHPVAAQRIPLLAIHYTFVIVGDHKAGQSMDPVKLENHAILGSSMLSLVATGDLSLIFQECQLR